MILLLGEQRNIREYLKTEGIPREKVYSCPACVTHHTKFHRYIYRIEERKPEAVITQSLEMVDILLHSHLDFAVITVRKDGTRTMTKEDALYCREHFDMELRD